MQTHDRFMPQPSRELSCPPISAMDWLASCHAIPIFFGRDLQAIVLRPRSSPTEIICPRTPSSRWCAPRVWNAPSSSRTRWLWQDCLQAAIKPPSGGRIELTEDGRIGIPGTRTLAGAVLPLISGIDNLARLPGLSLRDAILAATRNPGKAAQEAAIAELERKAPKAARLLE